MLQGAATLRAPGPWLGWITTYGYVENVGAAIAHAANHPKARRRLFNVADEPPMNHRRWVERIASSQNWMGSVEVSDDPANPVARAVGRLNLTANLALNADRLFQDLNFAPPVDAATAIRLTIQDERDRSRT